MIDDQGLIRFWNASSEKLFGYSQEEMFGRKLHSLVVPKEKLAKVDQNFTEFSRSGNGAMIGIVDEGEALRKDGSTFLAEVTVAKFFHQDRWYSVGTVRDISKRKSDEKRLQELACTDELTKIMNRRRFFELGLTEVQRSRRTGQSASCIMFDVDHFKRINDTYGHDVGDAVLKLLACTTSSTLREIDIFARIGGEEFAVILPETDITSALLVAERLRKRIADMCLMHSDTAISVTISMGVSQLKEQESFHDLLKRSDEALYAAKTSGRNRVINS
jgi:diguanylate cyclase (GGDEF)-like protein/PAS domain S-box-containing protein